MSFVWLLAQNDLALGAHQESVVMCLHSEVGIVGAVNNVDINAPSRQRHSLNVVVSSSGVPEMDPVYSLVLTVSAVNSGICYRN